MPSNFVIVRSRRRTGWCEFSTLIRILRWESATITVSVRALATEIRRKVSFKRVTGEAETGGELEEFTLVDRAGRVQIPREYLDELKIEDRARVMVEDGKVTLEAGDA